MDSCGTLAYVAPEVILKNGYKKEIDMWAVGVIMYGLISKSMPFSSDSRKELFKMIKEA